jgi:hypothetical protein
MMEVTMTPPPDNQPQPEPQKKRLTLADVAFGLGGSKGPDCIWCNAPTQKTGTCYTCVACGETTGCG